MPALEISFLNKEEQPLIAHLIFPPDGRPKAFALFTHCFPSDKNSSAVPDISRALTQIGFAVLQLDLANLSKDRDPFFSSSPDDVVAAARYLEKEYKAPKLLIGHSLGGTMTLLATFQIQSTEAIVTIGVPVISSQLKKLTETESGNTEGGLKAKVSKKSFLIKPQFLKDFEKASQDQKFKKLRKPLLIMHAPADNIVAIDNAAEIFKHTLHPKSFISLDQADHLLTHTHGASYAGSMIAAWVCHHIQTYTQSQPTADKQVVTRTRKTFTTDIVADQHTLIADEPESVGGHDLGPDPYDLIAASLGACTGMTLRMYADHKKWPLEEVRVYLQHKKVYIEDCSHCEDAKGKIDQIERVIELEGPLNEAQKKRLIEIANKCPVHKTLSTKTEIKTSFRENEHQ